MIRYPESTTGNMQSSSVNMTAITDIDMVLVADSRQPLKQKSLADPPLSDGRIGGAGEEFKENSRISISGNPRPPLVHDDSTQTNDIEYRLKLSRPAKPSSTIAATSNHITITATATTSPGNALSAIASFTATAACGAGKRLSTLSASAHAAVAAAGNRLLTSRVRRAMSHPPLINHQLSASDAAILAARPHTTAITDAAIMKKLVIDLNLQDIDLLTTIPRAKESSIVNRMPSELRELRNKALSDPLVTEYVYLADHPIETDKNNYNHDDSGASIINNNDKSVTVSQFDGAVEYTSVTERQPVMQKYQMDIDKMISSGEGKTTASKSGSRMGTHRQHGRSSVHTATSLVRKPTVCVGSLDTVLIQVPRTSHMDDPKLFLRSSAMPAAGRDYRQKPSPVVNRKTQSLLLSVDDYFADGTTTNAATTAFNSSDGDDEKQHNHQLVAANLVDDIDDLIGLPESQQLASSLRSAIAAAADSVTISSPSTPESATINGSADSVIKRPVQPRIDVDFLLQISSAQEGNDAAKRRQSVRQILNDPEYQVSLSAALLSLHREDNRQDIECSLLTKESINSDRGGTGVDNLTESRAAKESLQLSLPLTLPQQQQSLTTDDYTQGLRRECRDIDLILSNSDAMSGQKSSAALVAEEEFWDIFGI